MAQNKKQFKLHSVKLDADLAERLEAFCKETGLTKTAVIERGIEHYMDVYRALLTLPMARDKFTAIAETYKIPLTLKEQEAQRKGGTNED